MSAKLGRWLVQLAVVCAFSSAAHTQTKPKLHVLAFYSEKVEPDHVDFAHQAITFYTALAQRRHFVFTATTNWDDLSKADLTSFQLVIWLNDFPHTPQQRAAFERYMNNGGGWLGFHIAAYNDADTRWPWLTAFLGGGVFYGNNWPPLPATLVVEDPHHPVTRGLPATFVAPANEWYSWKPSPRLDKDVRVLISLAPENYPLGLKDVITGGDVPVVWTNTRFRMLYLNMGHGDQIFTSETQNNLFENALFWVAQQPAKKR